MPGPLFDLVVFWYLRGLFLCVILEVARMNSNLLIYVSAKRGGVLAWAYPDGHFGQGLLRIVRLVGFGRFCVLFIAATAEAFGI